MNDEKICVYTCITGDYDNLNEITTKEDQLDYYCFTNNKKLKSNTWNIIYIEDESLSNVELARKIKIMGHPIINQYDIAVWIDGSVKFRKSIKEFIKTYFTDTDVFSAFKHGERHNIKEESYECVRRRKEAKKRVKKLLAFYRKNKYHFDNGLIESTVYIKRPNNKKVQETMKLWFSMILNYSHRDQLSFNYCISQTDMPVHWINLKVFNNAWFKCEEHGEDKTISSYRIYFDTNEKYNINHDFSGQMTKKEKDLYQIKIKVPCNTKKTIVELSKVPFLQMSNLKINNIKKLKIHYFNSLKKDGKILFLNENPAFEIYNNLKEKQTLTITLKLQQLKSKELVEKMHDNVISLEIKNNNLKTQNSIIKNQNKIIKNQNEDIINELIQIKNSKKWKLFLAFDKIVGKRKEH